MTNASRVATVAATVTPFITIYSEKTSQRHIASTVGYASEFPSFPSKTDKDEPLQTACTERWMGGDVCCDWMNYFSLLCEAAACKTRDSCVSSPFLCGVWTN